ncbi:amino acid ABC transporter substrate-binding protein, PAAT family [Tistlia consotensis]|uniref:Amino acid ABC transporter substrate-binding protein, PAAT family n=1 Tax=Tistlia consotensis USBA 355 TaxID=560819 RepID=A0A1Y6BQV3_9PROT|nr:amino acid ABC transporter substrate-binding protein [Tistlia consotensis]SMF13571.1 amino acid ABC transporter substrate-binding protein, PAAT family [Tistlia consotensis USBA 355]SNR50380.1 amino acid ABC transporter substrate-binding protein, PAAT family [Tistlia consotensis]
MRLLLLLGLLAGLAGAARAGTIERLEAGEPLRLGVRVDAAPFSYLVDDKPAGYSVQLCRAVAGEIAQDLELAKVSIQYVSVDTDERFRAVADGRIDLLCGAATATLARRRLVDFSIPTFIDGAGVLVRADGARQFAELAGKRIGVRRATSTADRLQTTLKSSGIAAEVVPLDAHEEGFSRLQSGDIDAYFADRAILQSLMIGHGLPADLRLSPQYLSYEPYALALPRGDSAFRLAVDTALSRLYRSGAIKEIFASAFGKAEQSDLLKALYIVSALPE